MRQKWSGGLGLGVCFSRDNSAEHAIHRKPGSSQGRAGLASVTAELQPGAAWSCWCHTADCCNKETILCRWERIRVTQHIISSRSWSFNFYWYGMGEEEICSLRRAGYKLNIKSVSSQHLDPFRPLVQSAHTCCHCLVILEKGVVFGQSKHVFVKL